MKWGYECVCDGTNAVAVVQTFMRPNIGGVNAGLFGFGIWLSGIERMKCCEQELTTPFCPLCGKPANYDPAIELLLHCRSLQEKYEKEASEHLDETDGPLNERDRLAGRRLVGLMNKWQDRADALESLMKKDSV